MQTLITLFNKVLDILFPRECIGCRVLGTLLCAKCLAQVPAPFPAEHSFILSVFDYKNKLIKRAIWRFKYENARGFAEIFGHSLYDEIISELGDSLHVSENEKFFTHTYPPPPTPSTRTRIQPKRASSALRNETRPRRNF